MQQGKNPESRRSRAPELEGAALPPASGHGSEHAPTRRAERNEAERHAREEKKGHFAAGLGGRIKAVNVRKKSR
jgi:hypothetical protein